jgi:hypothetical protein
MRAAIGNYEARLRGVDTDVRQSAQFLKDESHRVWTRVEASGWFSYVDLFRLRYAVAIEFGNNADWQGYVVATTTNSTNKKSQTRVRQSRVAFIDALVRFNTVCLLLRAERPVEIAHNAGVRSYAEYVEWLHAQLITELDCATS